MATLLLALTVSACGASATPQPISYGCASAGGAPLSDSNLTVDIGSLGLDATVQVHVGETLTLGGGGPCGVAVYPGARNVRPVLEETGHHTDPFRAMDLPGYTDVTYRAAEPGRVRVRPSGTGLRPDQTTTVVVLPRETPAQAARRATGTITIAGAATGPVGTFALTGVTCKRVISTGGEWPAPGGMAFSTGGVTYQVAFNSSDYGPPTMVDVGRPVGTGMDWYIAASDPDPRTRPATLVDGGWVSGPIRALDPGRGGGTMSIRWWC